MAQVNYHTALIVGAGPGLSASLARAFATAGLQVALAARSTSKLDAIAGETGAKTFACDAADPAEVVELVRQRGGANRRAGRGRLQRQLSPARPC